MSRRLGFVYCQNCRAANPAARELCSCCGTRLMLVFEPSSLKHENEAASLVHEEHLLERVSGLENRLARITGKLEEGLELLLRQSRSSYHDHTLLESLIALLSETGLVDHQRLTRAWAERCQEDAEREALRERLQLYRQKIIEWYGRDDEKLFVQYLDLGLSFLERGQAARAIEPLESASLIEAENAPLNFLLGQLLFEQRKFKSACRHLERARHKEQQNPYICLLLGVVWADEGELEAAKTLLTDAVREGGPSFAGHYALGKIQAATKRDWAGALKHFKSALAAQSSPEALFLVGTAYYQKGCYRTVLRYLSKARTGETRPAIIDFLCGLTLLQLGDITPAREAFRAARDSEPNYLPYRAAARRPPSIKTAHELMASLLGLKTGAKRHFLTGGERSLAAALFKDCLGTSARYWQERR